MTQAEVRAIEARETWTLRQELLRPNRPLNESCFEGDEDASTRHWGAFLGDTLIAVSSQYRQPLPPSVDISQDTGAAEYSWRLRGMAVRAAFQGQGYGRQLLDCCLQSVAERGGKLLWCNARKAAYGFYQARGFQIEGSEFMIPDIGPHSVMVRFIQRGRRSPQLDTITLR